MFLINQTLIVLDVWLHGMNEIRRRTPIRNLLRSPKYNLIEKYLREVKPETEKEWLERFSFENIYFHRVPGAPPLGEGPDIKINTSLPI